MGKKEYLDVSLLFHSLVIVTPLLCTVSRKSVELFSFLVRMAWIVNTNTVILKATLDTQTYRVLQRIKLENPVLRLYRVGAVDWDVVGRGGDG